MKSKSEQLVDVRLRREKILEMVREDGTVTVKALTAAFGLTEATIRTDLRTLQQRGWSSAITAAPRCWPVNKTPGR